MSGRFFFDVNSHITGCKYADIGRQAKAIPIKITVDGYCKPICGIMKIYMLENSSLYMSEVRTVKFS